MRLPLRAAHRSLQHITWSLVAIAVLHILSRQHAHQLITGKGSGKSTKCTMQVGPHLQ